MAAYFGEMKNDGGFRIFVHRPFIPATDPDSAVYIHNNAEAFVNVDYKRDNNLEKKYSNKLSMKAREGWKHVLVDSTSRVQTVLEWVFLQVILQSSCF